MHRDALASLPDLTSQSSPLPIPQSCTATLRTALATDPALASALLSPPSGALGGDGVAAALVHPALPPGGPARRAAHAAATAALGRGAGMAPAPAAALHAHVARELERSAAAPASPTSSPLDPDLLGLALVAAGGWGGMMNATAAAALDEDGDSQMH